MNKHKKDEKMNYKKKSKEIMDDFITNNIKIDKGKPQKITLGKLKKIKEKGVSTEEFLDYFCKINNFLMHGSVKEIEGYKLKSNMGKIFASDKAAIAIMRSLYSNVGVVLQYPYKINKQSPLMLKINKKTPGEKYNPVKRGYVYIVEAQGFKNEPKDSWQYTKKEKEINFNFIVETERKDFKYPVEIIKK